MVVVTAAVVEGGTKWEKSNEKLTFRVTVGVPLLFILFRETEPGAGKV